MRANSIFHFIFNLIRNNQMRNKIFIAAILSAAIGAALPLSASAADTVLDNKVTNPNNPPLVESGTVEVKAEQIRLLVGGAKGTGVLHYKGKDYKFKLSGASVGGVGVTKVDAVGTVYNLKSIEEFPGTYSGGSVGAVAGKGVGASSWENPKHVVLKMQAKSAEGLALNLGLNAVTVELDK
jgi:hypothetical protein